MKNRIADKLPQASKSQKGSGSVEGQSNRIAEAALRQLNVARLSAETFVAAHPLICLGAAVATGIAVGWWVKRK